MRSNTEVRWGGLECRRCSSSVLCGAKVRILCRTLEFVHSNLCNPCFHEARFVMLEQVWASELQWRIAVLSHTETSYTCYIHLGMCASYIPRYRACLHTVVHKSLWRGMKSWVGSLIYLKNRDPSKLAHHYTFYQGVSFYNKEIFQDRHKNVVNIP